MDYFSRLLLSIFITGSLSAMADELKPYILGSGEQTQVTEVAATLENAGFTVVGQYTPYENAQVVVVTNEELKSIAAQSELGGFGAAIRVSVTTAESGTQVAYVNPAYMAAVYRLSDTLPGVSAALESALGNAQAFGSEKGISAKKLRKYHYMFAMPYFDDQETLAEYETFDAALAAVDRGLAAGVAGAQEVYRVALADKNEVLIGVGLGSGDGGDALVMSITDGAALKHTAHLPYELLVSEGKVYALPGRFRIAQSFPDLTMGTFMKIRSAPGAISDALRAVVSGQE